MNPTLPQNTPCYLQWTTSLAMEGSSQTPYIPLKPSTPHQSPLLKVNPAQVPAVGGRLAQFVEQWRHLTSCKWTLDTVRGYRLEFTRRPPPRPPPPGIPLSRDQQETLDKEIRDMLDKKAISKCWDREGFFSSVFLVPKKDKGWRPIINLKALNQYLKVQHFKMETINNLRDILKKGDVLENSSLLLPVHRLLSSGRVQ